MMDDECSHGIHSVCTGGTCFPCDNGKNPCDQAFGVLSTKSMIPAIEARMRLKAWHKETGPASEFVGEQQVNAAKRIGLDPDRFLPQDVADFYILERVVGDNRVPARVELVDGSTRVLEWAISGEGMDTAHERWQSGILRSFTSYSHQLATELAGAISVACGGEIRHAVGRDDDCEPELICGLEEHDHDFGYCTTEIICGLEEHEHDSDCFDAEDGALTCDLEEHYEHDEDCLEPCPEEEHEHDEDCWEYPSRSFDDVHPELSRLLEEWSEEGGIGRGRGWADWVTFREQNPGPEPMNWLAEAFITFWPRGSSVGGRTWATCAETVYLWETGVYSDATFINIAWTLEHNNGCIFNKLYPSFRWLKRVLNIQAGEPYDVLAEYASDWVRRAWLNNKRQPVLPSNWR